MSILFLALLSLSVSAKPAEADFTSDGTAIQVTTSSDPKAVTIGADMSVSDHLALVSEGDPRQTTMNAEDEYLFDAAPDYYVVRQGETIASIAKMYDISQNTIIQVNSLQKDQALKEGDILEIWPVSGVKYTIKTGDTLNNIAKKTKGDIARISTFNDITSDTVLSAGDDIFIPDGEIISKSSIKTGTLKIKSNYSGPSYVGYYLRPIIGGIRTQGIHGHNGVDLASSYGASILASADGDVIISRNSGWNGGYGSYIVLKHDNGTQTLYGHLSATLVNAGDHVTQGQVIGRMGNTGEVHGPTGIHLHFEIRGAINPF